MGKILTRTTTYIFRSIGFIFGCLQQHTKFWRRCWGVILVDFCASCDPYFILEIFNQKKKFTLIVCVLALNLFIYLFIFITLDFS